MPCDVLSCNSNRVVPNKLITSQLAIGGLCLLFVVLRARAFVV